MYYDGFCLELVNVNLCKRVYLFLLPSVNSYMKKLPS